MSEIFTFYSYKGGVGRTMALANVAMLLSKWGQKVLVVDWDLEAPGLEHFYKDYIDIKLVETTPGIIDLLQVTEKNKWQDCIIPVKTTISDVPIHLISSGRRDTDYFKNVRGFDVEKYYEQDNGGDIIEQLRTEWLENYDYVLIDSRTGITEIGGICTIQLPDVVVMLFTATNQGFDGILDIMKRASTGQQMLPYDRQKLIFLPIPSKFDSNTEFELSQKWLNIFADSLEKTYNDWLPLSIDRKNFLELTKIPYMSYFSFGEKLPVIDQGVRDPSGLGYAYESLAALIAHHLRNVEGLYNNRDQYIADVDKYYSPGSEMDRIGSIKRNGSIKRSGNFDSNLKSLIQELDVDNETKVEKSDSTIRQCLQENIVPLFKAVAKNTGKITHLFRGRNEHITCRYIFGVYFHFNPFLKSESETIIQSIDDYNVKNSYQYSDITLLDYVCSFNHFKKNDRDHFNINSIISIDFLRYTYEIHFDNENIIINKNYNEIVTNEELESIADAFANNLLEQIKTNKNK